MVLLGLGVLATFRLIIPVLERPPIKLRLEAPATVSAGQAIPFKLHVQNTGDRSIEVHLAGNPAHEFIVTKPDGLSIWRSVHGLVLVNAIKTIPAHEELILETEWDQKGLDEKFVSLGKYRVQGILYFTYPNYSMQTPWQNIEIQ